jgi:hypothetical protein
MKVGFDSNAYQVKNTADPKVEYPGVQDVPKQVPKAEKYSVFHIEGGLGKNVASTAIARLIKEKHPDRRLIVVASWPEVYLQNPHVDRVYRVGHTPYFYDDYILDKDVLIFRHEPYFQTSHITKKTQLIETWATLYGLPYSKDALPELYMNMMQEMIAGEWVRPKPILVLHTNGGPYDQQKFNYSWTRDMPGIVAQKIVEKYSKDYHIIQVCRLPEQGIEGVEVVHQPMTNMELFSLLRVSHKRVLIDSSLQHAAAAFRLPSTVLWVGTSPKVFGYNMHANIMANVPEKTVKLIDSYLFDYQFDGLLHECPFADMNSMFDMNKVFQAIGK